MQPKQTKAVLFDIQAFNTCFAAVTIGKVVNNFACLCNRFDLYITEFDEMLEFLAGYLK